LEELQKVYPHGYHKTCKLGRSIYIDRIGQTDLPTINKVVSDSELVYHNIHSYEELMLKKLHVLSIEQEKVVEQNTNIMDMTGFGIGKMNKSTWHLVKLMSGVAQDNYPEILGATYIVNAPMVFTGVWAIAKSFIDEKTRKKINIVGGGYKKVLLQNIDKENLPDFLGGECTCADKGGCLASDAGPWNAYDLIMEPRVGVKHKETGLFYPYKKL